MVIATSYKVCLETGWLLYILTHITNCGTYLWYELVCVLVLIEFSHYFSVSAF